VDYYSQWTASGNSGAPRYERINGTGSFEEIITRVMVALNVEGLNARAWNDKEIEA